jgi:DNA mismatch endonuclease (patch repair protein)
MVDRVTPQTRSKTMRAIRSKDTKPELAVRRLVHGMGYRYRLHRRDLPGSPDLVFPGRRKVLFVHGCFWHGHPDPECPRSHRPKSNRKYWEPKLRRNRQRDDENRVRLMALGWEVLVIWECETRDLDRVAKTVRRFLDPR